MQKAGRRGTTPAEPQPPENASTHQSQEQQQPSRDAQMPPAGESTGGSGIGSDSALRRLREQQRSKATLAPVRHSERPSGL